MKIIATILCTMALTLVGCGGGSEPEPSTMIVQLPADTELPSPFVIGPANGQHTSVAVSYTHLTLPTKA